MKHKKTKVTALVPTSLIDDIKALTEKDTITEALVVALTQWVSQQRLVKMCTLIGEKPLSFADNFSAKKVREINQGRKFK